jgi:hypothetical protein
MYVNCDFGWINSISKAWCQNSEKADENIYVYSKSGNQTA